MYWLLTGRNYSLPYATTDIFETQTIRSPDAQSGRSCFLRSSRVYSCLQLPLLVKGKTVRLRHKPVLAVNEGCSGWGRAPYPEFFRIRHWDIPGRRPPGRVIRQSESLPVPVDFVVRLQSQPLFSGLEKNEEIDTNLLNLSHYKELEVFGAYGPRREHMVQALPFCARQQENLGRLSQPLRKRQGTAVRSCRPFLRN